MGVAKPVNVRADPSEEDIEGPCQDPEDAVEGTSAEIGLLNAGHQETLRHRLPRTQQRIPCKDIQ